MAPGYVIALVCEAAGLAGLICALAVQRAERLAKASELRSFLRSGQSTLAVPAMPVRRAPSPRMRDLPVTPVHPRTSAVMDSTARSALHRAVARP